MVEGLRTDSLYIGNTSLRVSQLVSICLASVCFVLLVAFLIKYTKHPKPIEGVDFFPEKTPKELEEERKAQEKKEQKKLRKEARKVKIRDGKIVKDSRETENVSENIPPVEETVTYSEGDGKNADT